MNIRTDFVRVLARIHPAEAKAIDTMAKADDRSRDAMVRILVREALAARGIGPIPGKASKR